MKRVLLAHSAVLLLALFGCSAPTPQQKVPQHPAPIPVKRVEIPLDDPPVQGEASVTRNFYFVFDGSGSMHDGPDGTCTGDQRFPRKIDGAKWAVGEFLKKVPDGINLGLYVFDSHGEREVVPLGPGNRTSFLTAVQDVREGGGTPLAESMRFGADRLVGQYKKQLGYGEYRLIVVTDGLADGIPEAARYVANYGIPIYAIGLCIGENHPLRQYALSYRAADNFQDLAKGLEATLAETENFDAATFEELSK